ncbi:MAG: ubiquitin-like small modifier protein 1 [Longimicrobiales bacterium]|nr:ubiquitin-like small modifier protein 1 [Longimicrobiales bacterium]
MSSASRIRVILPGQLRELNGGVSELHLSVEGDSVGAVFDALRSSHRGVYDRIFTEQREVRPHVNIFVDGADIRWAGELETPVRTGSEVVVLPAVSGG